MNYRTFDNYQKGFSHEKNGTPCEDYAASYADPDSRFFISVICDGHSDNNCFRSTKGARFGCEAAIEILSRFFTLYYEEGMEPAQIKAAEEARLKKSIRQCWDQKVASDLKENPLTEEEMQRLSERVKALYKAGQGLFNIYGTTFAAVAASQDLFLVLHIGDGVVMCVNADGTYYEPLPNDENSNTGSPASLCDPDLFTREAAFRSAVLEQIPQAAVVSSDGIGDCMDQLQFMEFICSLLQKFKAMEQGNGELNEAQKQYLAECVSFYTKKGVGAEDDCSLAGFYAPDQEVPLVKLPAKLARQLWVDTIQEMKSVAQDYEDRKGEIIENIRRQESSLPDLLTMPEDWLASKHEIERLKKILNNIVNNEREKLAYYDNRVQMCREYVRRVEGHVSGQSTQINIKDVPLEYLKEDLQFLRLNKLYKEFREKKSKSIQLGRSWKDAEEQCKAIKQDVKRQTPEGKDTLSQLTDKTSELLAEYKQAQKEACDAERDWQEAYKAERDWQEALKPVAKDRRMPIIKKAFVPVFDGGGLDERTEIESGRIGAAAGGTVGTPTSGSPAEAAGSQGGAHGGMRCRQ